MSEDSAIGVIFAAFFAVGVVLISREAGFKKDLGSLLFGNVLGVSQSDVMWTGIIAAVVAGLVLLFLKEFTLVATWCSSSTRSTPWWVLGLPKAPLMRRRS